MKFVEITEENTDDFSDLIDMDVICDIDRSFFFGIGVFDDDNIPRGALVYELLNYDSDEDTIGRIHTLAANDDEIFGLLMSNYEEAVDEKEIVKSVFLTDDKGKADYLGSCGFSFDFKESPDIVFTVGDIERVAAMLSGKKLPPYIKSMSDVSLKQYRDFIKHCLAKGRFGLLEDLGYLPMSWFERDFSSCSTADDKMDGGLLVRRLPSNTLEPCVFSAFGIDYQKNLGIMTISTAKKVFENYPADNKIIIHRHNDSVRKLTDKLLPDIRGKDVYICTRIEKQN